MLQRCARMRYCARSTLTSISTVSFPTEWASTSSSTAFVSTAGLRYASAGAQRHLDDNPCLDRSQRRSVGLKFFSRGYAVQATAKPRVNEEIVAKFVRLVRNNDEGESTHEILSVPKAIAEAKRLGLDLVEVNGKASPPVCKFMDYERVRYDQKKRDKDKKKAVVQAQKRDEIKEIRVTAKIDSHDLNVKMNAAAKFLDAGYRVSFRIMFKKSDGILAENRAERGKEIIANVTSMLENFEIVTPPKMVGLNHMTASIHRLRAKNS